jgi:hypothetical protein
MFRTADVFKKVRGDIDGGISIKKFRQSFIKGLFMEYGTLFPGGNEFSTALLN